MENKGEEIKFASYPEGWEKAKEMIDFIEDEDAKQAFMIGYANNLLRM